MGSLIITLPKLHVKNDLCMRQITHSQGITAEDTQSCNLVVIAEKLKNFNFILTEQSRSSSTSSWLTVERTSPGT